MKLNGEQHYKIISAFNFIKIIYWPPSVSMGLRGFPLIFVIALIFFSMCVIVRDLQYRSDTLSHSLLWKDVTRSPLFKSRACDMENPTLQLLQFWFMSQRTMLQQNNSVSFYYCTPIYVPLMVYDVIKSPIGPKILIYMHLDLFHPINEFCNTITKNKCLVSQSF